MMAAANPYLVVSLSSSVPSWKDIRKGAITKNARQNRLATDIENARNRIKELQKQQESIKEMAVQQERKLQDQIQELKKTATQGDHLKNAMIENLKTKIKLFEAEWHKLNS